MPGRRFLMTPDMHRERAAALRRIGTPKALEAARGHEIVAKLIEKRLDGESLEAPPMAPA